MELVIINLILMSLMISSIIVMVQLILF
ncbi:uncharacterized protein METZ01_LOCUS343762, partial [marine metagenome]